MRIEDPNGAWIEHPRDSRVMIPVYKPQCPDPDLLISHTPFCIVLSRLAYTE